jgi:hypothetical protein
LEDGADVCNSESDSDNEDHGDKLANMYKGIPTDSQGRPLTADHKLANDQANAIRAAASQASRLDSPPAQERKPTPMNSDEDDQFMTEDQKRCAGLVKKKDGQPVEKSESLHPMDTRSHSKKASRAGGLRSAVGSGQADTRVANGHPSKT